MSEKELKARLEDEATRWASNVERFRLEEALKRERAARRTRSLEALLWTSAILMVASVMALFILAGGMFQ